LPALPASVVKERPAAPTQTPTGAEASAAQDASSPPPAGENATHHASAPSAVKPDDRAHMKTRYHII
jgi:hypothetical protein